MKRICILTATRAEYGLLKPLLDRLTNEQSIDLKIVATGAHLSPEFGLTYRDIESDGFCIDKKIEILVSADSPASISKSMGLAMMGFADYFSENKPDLLVVLGDRYETLAVAIVAMNERIPIAHLYGGETTEGAIDESIRHAITKLSYLHFTSTSAYRDRVIQLGEDPTRVYTVGGLGVENILQYDLMSKEELVNAINFNLNRPYAMVTFHPVTLEDNRVEEQCQALLNAIASYPKMQFVFTKANADAHGRIINAMIDKYVEEHHHAVAFTSLGLRRYLSGLRYATCVIGNSSSGLLEAPSFGIPTINIGDRQRGRLEASSVITCHPSELEIKKAIEIALSPEFRQKAKETINPYGDGNTSEKIVTKINDFLKNDKIELKKTFYDCGGK
ncbi:UDP-N-acetylglucosamine 2-epimerase [Amphibacillus cookii]|uniref:UDP-N-acetylglucosamine 2-epimerase n=1 Tax=Amphibacillus cookii TaxID=767787 RepID=UPI0019597A38|nr:UDP-N-acetylglucosamine 2-epimerase [Amphibacillus cookii]MBM7540035.1 GDP/UDP-N,N'-diacetylbacillosamine 2-epimerase (hydrolyzing) [Amphibacillus cookii]